MDIICNFKRDEGRSSAFGVQALIANYFVLSFKTHQNQDVKQILGKVNAALLKIKDMQQQPN